MKSRFLINSRGKAGKVDRRKRRFHVIDRAVRKARREIMEQEDARIFQALDDVFEIKSGNNQE